jgi:hypothetical protein ELI_2599
MRTIASDFPQKILRRFIKAYLLIFCRSYAILKSTPHSGSNDENEVIEMDIKAKIDEIVNKVKSDPDIASKFQKDPIKTVEGILGVDLPDDVIKQIVDGVKAKVNVDELKGKIGALGGLFDGR